MADLVLHESVLALGTEGYFFGDNSLDVRYPHWPGYQSGVSIGVGFDIGASRISAQELHDVMTILGVPDPMIKVLQKSINITGEAAKQILVQEKMREKVRLSQQQALDIMLVIKQKISTTVGKSFPQSYAIMHPAIIECLKKIAYGAPALVIGWKDQNWSGLGPMFDKTMSKISNHIEQCDLFIEMMSAMQAHKWVSSSVQDIHGTRVPRGLKSFIQNVKKELQVGNKVIIETGPITVEELLDPKNKTLDFAAEVSENTHKGGTTASYLRNQLSKARKEEPVAMQSLCNKIGCAVPPLSGSRISGENMNKCFKIMTGKDLDIIKAQQQLVILGYYDKAGISGGMRNADGAWGRNSTKALNLFQKDNGLSITTKLDAASKKLLFQQNNSSQNNQQSNNNNTEDENFEIVSDLVEDTQHSVPTSDTISASVGQGAANRQSDVKVVQKLLNETQNAGLTIDGLIGPATIGAIKNFQQKTFGWADGRIDVGGQTWSALSDGVTENMQNEDVPISEGSIQPIPLDANIYPCFN